jgi:hypothetical protein
MAWIESHQELGRHPKTRRLAKQLGISRPAAVGHLHYLWWWAMDFAQSGDVTDFDSDEIAEAALWDGGSVEFFQALATSGFIDVICLPGQDEKCLLHDWHSYAGRLVEKREANAKRMRDARAERQAEAAAPPVNERAAHVQCTDDARAGATVPNSTVPNRTEQNTEEQEQTPLPPVGADAVVVEQVAIENVSLRDSQDSGQKEPMPKQPAKAKYKPQAFDRVYLAYPVHEAKGAAMKRWDAVRPSEEEINAMLLFIEAAKKTHRWQRGYAPQFAPFLNEKRWEDDLTGYADRSKNGNSNTREPAQNPHGLTAEQIRNGWGPTYGVVS